VAFRRARLLPQSLLRSAVATLAPGADFVMATPLPDDALTIAGDIVFVSYGVSSTALRRDDLRAIDVKGKLVLVLGGRPAGVDSVTWETEASQQQVLGGLVFRGAKALLVANAGTKEQPYDLVQQYLMRTRVDFDRGPVRAMGPVAALVSDAGIDKLLGGAYADVKRHADAGDYVSRVVVAGATLELHPAVSRIRGRNVVALLAGRDADRRQEAVAFSAHYDAYGVDEAGRIFPGAADNALGTAEMLAAAEAFVRQPVRPRRSLLFLAVTGEEHGLLGAEAWMAKPTWPLDRVAANLNLDGIGTEVYAPVARAVGFGAGFSDLGAIFARTAHAMRIATAEDPFPEEKVFERSDHYAFVKKGIPALMLLGAPADDKWVARARRWMEITGDYHQPGDTVRGDWDWSGPRTMAQLMALIGSRVADQEAVPAWVQGSPFDKPRPMRTRDR
jgi:hypothetical protein